MNVDYELIHAFRSISLQQSLKLFFSHTSNVALGMISLSVYNELFDGLH